MSPTFDEHLATARALLDERERDKARIALEAAQALARTPAEHALVLNGLADVTFFFREDRQGGLDLLDRSIALSLPLVDSDPQDMRAALALTEACTEKSKYLVMTHRSDEALAPLNLALDRLLEAVNAREPRNAIERDLRHAIVRAMRMKVGVLMESASEQSVRNALACSQDLVRRFRDVEEYRVKRAVAYTLCRSGWMLERLGRNDQQITVYDDVIARYGHMQERRMREVVLEALDQKVLAYRDQEDFEATLEACDNLIERYESDPEDYAMDAVAKTMIRKGGVLNKLGKIAPELACYDKVIAIWAEHPEWMLRKHAAEALISKAVALNEADQTGAEMECYEELLRRYAEDEHELVRSVAAHGLVYKGLSLRAIAEDAAEDTGVLETEPEIACYDRVIDRYGAEKSISVRRAIAEAFLHKGESLLETGRTAEAAPCFDAVIDRHGASRDPAFQEMVRYARELRAEC